MQMLRPAEPNDRIVNASRTNPSLSLMDHLRLLGLRPTRQRMALAKRLFGGGPRHISAEQLHSEAMAARIAVSLATVYNTLHQFTNAGLLHEVVIDSGRSYFDTNTSPHHHFFYERSGRLEDIPVDQVSLDRLPAAPPGTRIRRVEVIVRVDG